MTETNSFTAERSRDEFSPKKFIRQVQNAFIYLLSGWKILLATGLVFAVAGFIYYSFKKPQYTAETTFALDEGAAQSANNEVSTLSEQLGLGTMMDAGGVFSSVTNIVELMQSRLMMEKTLRRTVVIHGKSLLFADFFLDSLHYREKWLKGSTAVLFAPGKKTEADSLTENSIIRAIYETLLLKNIKIDKKGKGTSIVSVTCTSEHELFSDYFLQALIQEVTAYYILTKTERASTNVAFLQHRTDSMRNAYTATLFGRAQFSDAHLNTALQTAAVPAEKQLTDVQLLKATYMDLVRSLESAKTTLMRETPLIQYIDTPILPLKMSVPGVMKGAIVFLIVGIFLAAFIRFLHYTYRYIVDN